MARDASVREVAKRGYWREADGRVVVDAWGSRWREGSVRAEKNCLAAYSARFVVRKQLPPAEVQICPQAGNMARARRHVTCLANPKGCPSVRGRPTRRNL